MRKYREFCRKWRHPRHFWVLLHAVNLRHGTDGRRAEDFFARKIRRLRGGLNPRTRVPEASTLTSRPPKPLLFPEHTGSVNTITSFSASRNEAIKFVTSQLQGEYDFLASESVRLGHLMKFFSELTAKLLSPIFKANYVFLAEGNFILKCLLQEC